MVVVVLLLLLVFIVDVFVVVVVKTPTQPQHNLTQPEVGFLSKPQLNHNTT